MVDMVVDYLEQRFGVFACLPHHRAPASNSHWGLLGVLLAHLRGHCRTGSRIPRYMGGTQEGIHRQYPSTAPPKIRLRTLQGVQLDGLLGREWSRTRGKVQYFAQNTAIEVECSRGGDASGRLPAGENVELGVYEGPRTDGIV
jgi:hypothetical protein